MELPTIGGESLELSGAISDAEGLRTEQDAGVAAKEFEKLLATIMVKELRRGLPDGFFGEGPGRDVYEGWMDEHLGAALTEGEGLGLRVALERGLLGSEGVATADADSEVKS